MQASNIIKPCHATQYTFPCRHPASNGNDGWGQRLNSLERYLHFPKVWQLCEGRRINLCQLVVAQVSVKNKKQWDQHTTVTVLSKNFHSNYSKILCFRISAYEIGKGRKRKKNTLWVPERPMCVTQGLPNPVPWRSRVYTILLAL